MAVLGFIAGAFSLLMVLLIALGSIFEGDWWVGAVVLAVMSVVLIGSLADGRKTPSNV